MRRRMNATSLSCKPPLPIAVLASGRGSNLEALIAARDAGQADIDIVLVAGDKPQARALRLAEQHGIASLALEPAGFSERAHYDRALLDRVAEHGAQLIVLAGFMRILDARAIAPWNGRIINIHPSLLPKYRGLHTHRRVLEAGDSEHGASVHFVSAELDGGPLIAQVRMPVLASDTEDSLAARLLPLEHRLLTAVVQAIATGKLRWSPEGSVFSGRHIPGALELASSGFGLHSGKGVQSDAT